MKLIEHKFLLKSLRSNQLKNNRYNRIRSHLFITRTSIENPAEFHRQNECHGFSTRHLHRRSKNHQWKIRNKIC